MDRSQPSGLVRAFATSLRYFRMQGNLSQEQLAFKAGVDRTYVSGIERGRRNPTLGTIGRLISALEIDEITFVTRLRFVLRGTSHD